MIRRTPAPARARRMFYAGALLLAPALLAAQTPFGADRIPGMSKQMSLGIEHYEKGEDLQAMDRFMEVLTQGDPSERPVANEYMNLITQRMALGQEGVKRPAQPPLTFERPTAHGASPGIGPDQGGLLPPPGGAERRDVELTGADRAAMRQQIENRLQSRAALAIGRLRKFEDIHVHMLSARLPKAIALPASLLFNDGVLFKKDASEILDTLSDLAYSLGATQLVLLPERAMLGDSKILDMRRTMAISSHLFKAGIAPSRVRVNLLSNQVDVPSELQGFQGILISFVYNQPLPLTTDSSLDAETGPPISIGVSPAAIDPRKDEGAVIEFSVIEPPSGLMSWSFQLSSPGKGSSGEMTVLQDVKGASPVFHQIFWNGRKGYFGEPLPAGRYQCLLSATDMKGRTRKKVVGITVLGPLPTVFAEAAKAPKASHRTKRPRRPEAEAELEPGAAPGPRRVTIGRRPPKRRGARRAPPPKPISMETVKEAPPQPGPAEPTAAPSPEAVQPASPSAGANAGAASGPVSATSSELSNWTVPFEKGTLTIIADGDAQMAKAADTLSYYPLENLQLVGFANTLEPDSEALAARRADYVAGLLSKKFPIDPKRVLRQHRVVANEYYKVEIYMLQGK